MKYDGFYFTVLDDICEYADFASDNVRELFMQNYDNVEAACQIDERRMEQEMVRMYNIDDVDTIVLNMIDIAMDVIYSEMFKSDY